MGGDDGVTATTLPSGVIKLTEDGGAGDDTLFASQGVDTFLGGDGNEFTFGDNGTTSPSGVGDDEFQWAAVTATTPSRVRTAPTRCCSSAPTSPRTRHRPNGDAACSSATLLP